MRAVSTPVSLNHSDGVDDSDGVDGAFDDEAVLAAAMALAGRRFCILGGAGVSTDSGIPDYRGAGAAPRQPLRFDAFVGSEAMRRRYWARAFVGWPRIRDAAPNEAHRIVALLSQQRRATGVITQNVDGLHQRAGASDVVELHGALRIVRCLGCGARCEREIVQQRLAAANPWVGAASGVRVGDAIGAAPDGDTDLDDALVERFIVVPCDHCGGVLKPDVVFFGENVDSTVRQIAFDWFNQSDALVVIGTSLEVLSGRRFVEDAARRRWPIVLINRGPTRADHLVTVKLDGGVAQGLRRLFDVTRG